VFNTARLSHLFLKFSIKSHPAGTSFQSAIILFRKRYALQQWRQATLMINIENDPYFKEINKWRRGLDDALRRENSWLALSGLFWLKEGKNSIGSDPDCNIPLPIDAAPQYAGFVTLEKGCVSLRVSSDIGFKVNGQLIEETVLQPDTSDAPTKLTLDQLTIVAIQRGHQFGIRLWDNTRSKRTNFPGRLWYPINRNYRIWADYVTYDPPKTLSLKTMSGNDQSEPAVGSLAFDIDGNSFELEAFDGPEGGLFVIFTDSTNKDETYPAGRYLTTIKPEQGKVRLDFNRAYNPPCAFTPYATCPLAPPQNHLPVRIPAGERYRSSDWLSIAHH
jgi:uncharacterized protein (DUF1684 family)